MSNELNEHSWIIPEWPAPSNVKACITTRAGGVSKAPYDTNNLGTHVGDSLRDVTANREQLVRVLALEKSPQWLEQVHGIKVATAKDDGLVRTADAVTTTDAGQACVVMTADCLPILMCDEAGTQVAAIHCGWRSLAKGICAKTIETFSVPPSRLMAYLGPAISQTNFEVGIDVLEAFFEGAQSESHQDAIARAFKPASRPLHFYADIYALARAELAALGVTNVYGGGYCTYAESTRFYSYRREKVTGRMASLIWLI